MLSKRLSHALPPNSRLSERCVHVPHMSGPCVRRRNARTLCDFVLDVRRGDARMIAVLIAQIILSHAITSRCVCVCVYKRQGARTANYQRMGIMPVIALPFRLELQSSLNCHATNPTHRGAATTLLSVRCGARAAPTNNPEAHGEFLGNCI